MSDTTVRGIINWHLGIVREFSPVAIKERRRILGLFVERYDAAQQAVKRI